MSDVSSPVLGLSRLLLRILVALNLAMGALMILGFAATFVFEDGLSRVLRAWLRGVNLALLLPTVRVWLLLALPGVAAIHLLFVRTLDILRAVRLGHPFEAENAARLRTMAWCLLVVQLLQLANGVMSRIATIAHARINWEPSLVGWLAVLLLFVLAGVFDAGARMRSELEAMI